MIEASPTEATPPGEKCPPLGDAFRSATRLRRSDGGSDTGLIKAGISVRSRTGPYKQSERGGGRGSIRRASARAKVPGD